MSRQIGNDESAASPVVGIILVVGLTIIVAGIIGGYTYGLGGSIQQDAPDAVFTTSQADDGTIQLLHESGEPVDTEMAYIPYESGDVYLNTLTDQDQLSTGDSVNIPAPEGDSIDVAFGQEESSSILSSPNTAGVTALQTDLFCTDTSSEYDISEEYDRGTGSQFSWGTGTCLLQTDSSNDDLSAVWSTDIGSEGNPNNLRVVTRAVTSDDDGVGVVITTQSGDQYEAVVTDDYPDGSGIYKRSGGELGGGDLEAATSNTYTAQNEWHRIAMTYDGRELKMYVDGNLEATHSAPMTPKKAGLVSLANDPAGDYEYVSISSTN